MQATLASNAIINNYHASNPCTPILQAKNKLIELFNLYGIDINDFATIQVELDQLSHDILDQQTYLMLWHSVSIFNRFENMPTIETVDYLMNIYSSLALDNKPTTFLINILNQTNNKFYASHMCKFGSKCNKIPFCNFSHVNLLAIPSIKKFINSIAFIIKMIIDNTINGKNLVIKDYGDENVEFYSDTDDYGDVYEDDYEDDNEDAEETVAEETVAEETVAEKTVAEETVAEETVADVIADDAVAAEEDAVADAVDVVADDAEEAVADADDAKVDNTVITIIMEPTVAQNSTSTTEHELVQKNGELDM
jgi:hypothetical protein